MEWLRLVSCVDLNLIEWRQDLVINWPPPIVLYPFVPALMLIVFRFVELDVDSLLLLHFFYLVVISGCERVDVTHGSMNEDLVVDQRWELETT